MFLTEDRTVIPEFKGIWKTFKRCVSENIKKTKPSVGQGFNRWQFSMRDMTPPSKCFFNKIIINFDLFLVQDEYYDMIREDFNDSEVSPNMSLTENGKVNLIVMRIRVASSPKNLFKDLLPDFNHELTHAYDYYIKLKDGVPTKDLRKDTAFEYSTLRSIINNSKLTPLEKNLAVFFYFIDPSEYNGRLNTFYGEIYHKKTLSNIKEVIESTRMWKQVVFLENVPHYMKMVNNKEDQNKLIRIGNLMNKNKTSEMYTSYNALLNDVINQYNKLRKDTYDDFVKIVMELSK